jgi:hypothetical protein
MLYRKVRPSFIYVYFLGVLGQVGVVENQILSLDDLFSKKEYCYDGNIVVINYAIRSPKMAKKHVVLIATRDLIVR